MEEWYSLPSADLLKTTLDRLYADFNSPDSASDPIQIVRRFDRPDDREVLGFFAASLAFGRVGSVLAGLSTKRVTVSMVASFPRNVGCGPTTTVLLRKHRGPRRRG